MSDKHDNLEEQSEARPFLASTEAHQATLMTEPKHGHKKVEADENEPAPMLPPIVNHASTNFIDENEATQSAQDIPNTEAIDRAKESISVQAEAHDMSHQPAASYYPNSRRIVTGAAVALVALAGFSTAWYSANQDIYTLGNSTNGQPTSNNASETKDQAASTQPATLGAGTVTAQAASLNFKHLPNLTQGYYFLWLKQDNETSALGKFSINDDGKAITDDNKAFEPKLSAAQSGSTLLVSIESSDNPEEPSHTIILSGEIKDNKAALRFTAIDLSKASGVYTIAAPTDLSGELQSSGIWFAKSDGHTLTGPGLSVPNAPEGWKYEAQLIYKDEIIAAGRFANPNDRDDFGVFTPNPDHTPNFPGEDYIQGAPSRLGIEFPANLTSGEWKVIISIEPDFNGSDPTGDGTFFLQPFTTTIAEGTENFKEQSLKLDTSKFPTATVVFK